MMTLPENPYSDRFAQFYVSVNEYGYTRPITIDLHDSKFANVSSGIYSCIAFYISATTNSILRNVTFENVSSNYGIVVILFGNNITMDGMYLTNVTKYPGYSRVFSLHYTNLKMSNLVLKNDRSPSDDSDSLHFLLRAKLNSYVEISNLHASTLFLIRRIILQFDADEKGVFVLKDSSFQNLRLYSGNSLIETVTLKGLQISN